MLQLTFALLCFTHIAACVLHFVGLPMWDDSDCADNGMCGWVERQAWVTAKDCAGGVVDHDGVVADSFDSLGLDFQTEAAAGSCLETPRLVRYGASFYCKRTRIPCFPSPLKFRDPIGAFCTESAVLFRRPQHTDDRRIR